MTLSPKYAKRNYWSWYAFLVTCSDAPTNLPIFLLYLVIQKQFVESMTMTGVKG